MEDIDREFLDHAIGSGYGENRFSDIDSRLLGDVIKDRFNFDHAAQMYKFALDDIVYKALGDARVEGKTLVPDTVRWEYAKERAEAIGRNLGVTKNQRPTRKGISALLFGK